MGFLQPRNRWTQAWTMAPLAIVITLSTAEGVSKTTPHAKVQFHEFPQPPTVAKQVWFWERVFGKYTAHQVIIHDLDSPDLIIDIIDFDDFKKKLGRTTSYSRRDRERLTKNYLERYQLAVTRFSQEREAATKHGPMEQRLLHVYKRNRSALARLYRGKVTLRSQAGLADEFIRAAERAEKYLPHMEKIFAREHLPIELTRIAFVESMFNPEAISKVGASGVWQFMRSTAKLYMNVNHYVDERNDPITATRGAARLLRDNYAKLRSWPLAITAYNHGAAGMARASRTLGTDDIGQIIDYHKSNSFGFASKNFYGEFLAARNIYHEKFRNFRGKAPNPLNVARIPLKKPVSVHQIIKYTKMDAPTMKSHNPHILPHAYHTYKYQALPSGLELVVPSELATSVQSAIQRIKG